MKTKNGWFLNWLYTTKSGNFFLPIFVSSTTSRIVGSFMHSRFSRPFAIRTAKKQGLSNVNFKSYNDYFIRENPSQPIIDEKIADKYVISPSAGRVSAYLLGKNTQFRVKRAIYNIESLLRDKDIKKYENGYALVIRLMPHDIHRYGYAVSGKMGKIKDIEGVYHTVRSIAHLSHKVYLENHRQYVVIETTQFGKVVQMEVGAMCIGAIHNHKENIDVRAGDEKGWFSFGGSSIVLLFEEHVKPKSEFFYNTEKGLETWVEFGERLL